jgi:hypothetical protein
MPQGFKLTNPFAVAKPDATDLVELAREIQSVSTFYIFACCSWKVQEECILLGSNAVCLL